MTDFLLATFTGTGNLSIIPADIGGDWLQFYPPDPDLTFLELDGSGNLIITEDYLSGEIYTTALPSTVNYTVEVKATWLTGATGGAGVYIFGIDTPDDFNGWQFKCFAANFGDGIKIYTSLYISDSTGNSSPSGSNIDSGVVFDIEHTIKIEISNSNNTFTTYVDNIQQESRTKSGIPSPNYVGFNFVSGEDHTKISFNNVRGFSGSDEIISCNKGNIIYIGKRVSIIFSLIRELDTALELRYSGGINNNDPELSLGGVMSTEKVVSNTYNQPINITGVSIVKVDVGGEIFHGAWTLSYNISTQILTWLNNTYYTVDIVVISGSGRYILEAGYGALIVDIDINLLPTSNQSDQITITYKNGLFSDLKTNTTDNAVYYCIYAVNTHPTKSFDKVSLYRPEITYQEIYIGRGTASLGDGVTTGVETFILSNATAPSGVIFTNPIYESYGAQQAVNLGPIGPGQVVPIWIKRLNTPITPKGLQHARLQFIQKVLA